MKTLSKEIAGLYLRALWVLSVLFALVAVDNSARAAGTTTWSGGGGANQSWSAAANWTTMGGGTPPGAGDAVIFRATGAASSAGTINNIADSSFTATLGSLLLSNEVANTFHTTQIPSDNSLTVNGPIVVGGTNQTATYTFTDGGALQGGTGTSTFTVATVNGGTLTLDLSPLTNFVYNSGGAGGTFSLGLDPGFSSGGVMKLAAVSNNITATTMTLGNNNSSGTSTLNLGAGTNIINADTLRISFDKSIGTLQFNSSSGGLRLRNAAGTGRTTVTICDNGHSGSSSATTIGNVSLKGHSVDMMIGTLTLANRHARTGGSDNAFFSFDTGIVDATNINMAINASGGTAPVGALSVGGGTLKVANNISLVNCAGAAGTGSLIITNGGVVACGGSIVKTTTVGTGNVTVSASTLTLNSAAGVIGNSSQPINTLNLTNATLHLKLDANVANTKIVATTINTNGVIAITIDSIVNASGLTTFPLISYTGNDPFGSLSLNLPPGYTGNLVDDTADQLVQLSVTAPVVVSLVWVGATNSVLVGNWDTNETKNWVDAATRSVPQVYADPATVLFDDTASNSTVTLITTNAPASVTVNNNSLNLNFNGGGKISGSTGLTKQGNATLTLAETGGDDFSGDIAVNGGTLVLDNTNSAISGGLTIAGRATVQIGRNDGGGALPVGSLDVEGTLIFRRADNVTVSTVISGNGSLTQNGNGTLTLNNVNSSYYGNTTVSKGTLALTGSGTISNSTQVQISDATLDVSGLGGRTATFSYLSVTNTTFNVAISAGQTPINDGAFVVDGIAGTSNRINVLSLPAIASYPVTVKVIQSGYMDLTGGNFNFALGSLPAASPSYAGSLSESGDGTAVLLTLTSGPVGIRPSVTWAGIVNVSADTNWSSRLNWQLPGAPDAGDNVFFDGTTTVGDNVTINNVVDTSFTTASLTYNQTAGSQWHNTLIPAGSVLTVTGALGIGAGTPAGSTTSVTISGPGELDANGVLTLNGVGGTSDSHATLDMSGLSTFKNIVPAATMALGTVAQQVVTLSLASNSIINVATLNLEATAGNNGRAGTLNLGALTNTIYASTINISTGKGATTKIQFGANAPNGTVAIGGTGGGAARATMLLGNATSGSASCNGQLLLAGHLANVLAGTVTLGGVGGATGNSSAGTVTFDNGTFDATSLFMGSSTSAHSSSGTFTVGGDAGHTAILNVSSAGGGSLVLGNASITGGTGAGTLNISINGTANINCSITKNTTAGAINTGTISLTDGKLNMVSGTIGTLAAPIDTLNLSDNGSSDTLIRLNVRVGATNIAAAAVNVLSGKTTINIDSIAGVIGATQIPLISYNNGSSPIAGLVLGTVPAGYTVGNGGLLVDNTGNQTIDVIVTPPAPLIWKGAVGSVLNSSWDTGTLNWLNGGTPATYADVDFVQFDDTASNSVVTLATTVSPAGINVSNNVLTYTFNGAGKISGPVGLVKQGAATWTLDNSGSNDFSGGVNIIGGALQIGNNDANGILPSGNVIDNGSLVFNRTDSNTVANVISGSGTVTQNGSGTNLLSGINSYGGTTLISGGTIRISNAGAGTGNSSLGAIPGGAVTITNGGTLDVGGNSTAQTLGFTNAAGQAKQFYIAGAGAGGNGAIVNNGTVNQQNAFQYITLTANAAWGGPARWDMRGNGAIIPILDLGGHTLTKTGSNQMSMVALIVTNSGDIVINSGILSFETTSTFTNGTGTIFVNAGGVLGHFRENAGCFTRPITLNGGMIRDLNGTPGATNDSPITLTANSVLDLNVGSTDLLRLNGVIAESAGSFGLTKTNVGSYSLAATNTYSGTTLVAQGRLILVNNGSISQSKLITVASGATFDASQRDDGTLLLNASQTLSGFGTVTGIVTTASGSTVAPGSAASVGTLTFANNLTLGGTNLMKLDRTAGATNDVLSVAGALVEGGTLNVTMLGGTPAAGDAFTLFSAAGGISGSFTATNLPALPGLGWVTTNLANGILKVVATVNLNPTNITAVVSGNLLTLSWPSDHTGWRLQVQTNSLGTGLNTNWFDVTGSTSVSTVNVTMDPANGAVFYRLVYP